jgi:cytochrome P450
MSDVTVVNTVAPPAAAPTLPTSSLLGHLSRFRTDPIGLFREGAALGDVVRFPVGPRSVYLLRQPEHIKYVLQDACKYFTKQTKGYHSLRFILGNGLVTSEGDFWLRQRRIAQPAFHRQRIAQFGDSITSLTEEMLDRWARNIPAGRTIDVAKEMMALTLRIMGRTLLSTELSEEAGTVASSLVELLHQIIERTTQLVSLPVWLPTQKNRRMLRAREQLNRIVYAIIAERRRAREAGTDLLGMLMDARDEETGAAMNDEQLRDEVMTIFLAGHETTSNALSWAFYLLSQHPQVEAKLRAETHAVLGWRAPKIEDLPRLPYAMMVIQEAMRLYPPVWLLMRRSERPESIDGYRIPVHSFIAISPYMTQRDARCFKSPDEFLPERFAPQNAAAMHRFAYFPFGAGPRVCIGNNFALIEAQLILATVIQRFSLKLMPGHPVEPHPTVTLRPRHGIRMSVHAPDARAEVPMPRRTYD